MQNAWCRNFDLNDAEIFDLNDAEIFDLNDAEIFDSNDAEIFDLSDAEISLEWWLRMKIDTTIRMIRLEIVRSIDDS